MEPALLLTVLNVIGVALLFLARYDWPRNAVWEILKWAGKFHPARRLNEKLSELEGKIEALADRLAISVLKSEFIGNHVDHAVCTTDSKGLIIWASDSFLSIFGRPMADMLGENWVSTIYQEDRGSVYKAWTGAVESHSNFTYDFRTFVSHPGEGQDELIWLSAFARYARNPLSGKIAGWVFQVSRKPPPPEPERCINPDGPSCPSGAVNPYNQ